VKKDYGYLKLNPKKPVLFLDLDGVLNNCMSSTAAWYPETVSRQWFGHDHIEAHKADLLISLLKHREAQIVLVSSWVRCYLPAEAVEIMELKTFFDFDDLKGSVNTTGGSDRGESVLQCVEFHGLDRWAVLDDADQLYDLTRLGPGRLFAPHGRYGITDQLLESLDNEALSEAPEEAFVPPWRLS
jgi:hypothetical protein